MTEQSAVMTRAWLLSIALLVAGGGASWFAAVATDNPVGQPFQLHWALLAIGFVLAEAFPVHLDVRDEAQTLTFTEAPLAFGLVLATPTDLILVRMAVAVATLLFVRRNPPLKVVFNIGMFALQVASAVLVFHAILGDGIAVEPRGWLAGMTAVVAGYLVSAVAVTAIMAILGSFEGFRSQAVVIGVGLTASIAGAFAALAAAGSLWRDSNAWIPLAVIVVALGFFGLSYLRLRQRHEAVDRLNEYTSALVTNGGVDELGATVASGMGVLLGANRACLQFRSDGHLVQFESILGAPATRSVHDLDDDWVRAHALAEADPVGWPLPHVAGIPLVSQDVIVRSLGAGDDAALVFVDGRRTESRTFDAEDVRVLETAAGHAATALHNARLVRELRLEAKLRSFQALHDETTGLPNSRGLAEEVQGDLDRGEHMCLVTVRVGSLREVNETLGRKVGDQLLQLVAARLAPLVQTSSCARTGNDEFTLAVSGRLDVADPLAADVVAAFDEPVQCAGVSLAVSVGVGVVVAPDHGREVEMLLRRASLAASRSQVEGAKISVWAADRDPYDPQRLAIAADLRDAIPAGELDVHFQPQVDSRTGLVTGGEALVRWHHPRLGDLRPDQFIAAAEYTGSIDALTAHVLGVAASTCAEWRLQGWDFDVAVNVSARNLSDGAFADTVRGILADAKLDPRALTLELTESTVMTEAERSVRTMEDLHHLGVSLSIDDFGTGYSSLAHLRRLPVTEIKVDKSFVFDLVTNPSDQAIVRAMIELGRNLAMRVVVEGVETVEVRQRLQEMGADRIQGYLLSRPVPAKGFEQWIADRPVRMIGGPTAPGELGDPRRPVDPADAHIRERLSRMQRNRPDGDR